LNDNSNRATLLLMKTK